MNSKDILYKHAYELYARTMDAADIAVPGVERTKLIATLKKINRGPTMPDGSANNAWAEADWVLRLLSLAFYAATEIDGLEDDIDELVSVLCFGNWAIGALEGTLGNERNDVVLENNAASFLAHKRHSENRQLSSEAIEYWRNNIDPKLSASKAANELLKVVPLSHKKLAELVAAEKKKQT